MPTVSIKINVAGESEGVPGQSRIFPYSKISGGDVLISLSLGDNTGITTYFWELVDVAKDSSAVLSDPTSSNPTFTATQGKAGTYLIRCTVNDSVSSGTNGVAFTTQYAAIRPLAFNEALEFGSEGWTNAINDAIFTVDAASVSISGVILKDGSIPFEADQPMGGYSLTGMRSGAASGEPVEYDQFNTAIQNHDLDVGYSAFGSSASVDIDNAEGQGALQFNVYEKNEFIVDISNAADPDGFNGAGTYYGFKVQNGADYFTVGRVAADQLHLKGSIQSLVLTTASYCDFNTDTLEINSTSIELDATSIFSVRADGITIDHDGTGVGSGITIEYDKINSGNTSFAVKQNAIPKLGLDSSGVVTAYDYFRVTDGNAANPSISFTSDTDLGIYRATTDLMGFSAKGELGFFVGYNTLTSASFAAASNTSGQAYLGLSPAPTWAHGSAADIGTLFWTGANDTPAQYSYATIIGHVVDNTAASEDSELRFQTSVAGALATRMSLGQGLMVGSGTDPGAGKLFVENDITFDGHSIITSGGRTNNHESPVELADDTSFTLPDASTGWGFFLAGNSEAHALVKWTASGTITLIAASANVSLGDNDNDFCFINGGTQISVKNRLGATKKVMFEYHYYNELVV